MTITPLSQAKTRTTPDQTRQATNSVRPVANLGGDGVEQATGWQVEH
ncbi:hypothetical protein [Isosphaera pallida]|nr:hypothetical protein [Isosphaera pallida]